MNINTDQLAISFETLNNLFVHFLGGWPRIKARVWLKKVALKGILNLDPQSINEKFGDNITEKESEQFYRELESWGLTGVHPQLKESEGIFTFILWNDLWKVRSYFFLADIKMSLGLLQSEKCITAATFYRKQGNRDRFRSISQS